MRTDVEIGQRNSSWWRLRHGAIGCSDGLVWKNTAMAVLVLLFVGMGSASADTTDLLTLGIQQYTTAMESTDRDQRLQAFAAAEQLFRQVAQSQSAYNAELQVSIGNAALQAERVGPAIVAFRRALAIAPTNSQAQQNLGYARSAVPETYRRESSSALIDTLFFWRAVFTERELLGMAAVSFLCAALLFAIGIARNQFLLRNLALVPFLGWCVLIGSVWMVGNRAAHDDAVVVADELIVHSADSENSAPRLSTPLTSGVEVSVLRNRGRWTEVEISGGRTGWVLTSGVELLAVGAS